MNSSVVNSFWFMYVAPCVTSIIATIIVGLCHVPLSQPLRNIMIFWWWNEHLENTFPVSLRLTILFNLLAISGLSIIFWLLLQSMNILHAWEHMVTIYFIILLSNAYGCNPVVSGASNVCFETKGCNSCCKRGISCVTCSIPRRPLFLHMLSFECTTKLCINFLNQCSVYFHI